MRTKSIKLFIIMLVVVIGCGNMATLEAKPRSGSYRTHRTSSTKSFTSKSSSTNVTKKRPKVSSGNFSTTKPKQSTNDTGDTSYSPKTTTYGFPTRSYGWGRSLFYPRMLFYGGNSRILMIAVLAILLLYWYYKRSMRR